MSILSSEFSKDKNMVYLRPLSIADKKNICRWMSSAYIMHNSFVVTGPSGAPSDFGTDAYAARYFENILMDPKRKSFAIMLGDIHVGIIGLKDIDLDNARAECFIEIGERRFRGLGIGYKAMEQLLEFAFGRMLLTKIELEVLEFNQAAISLYEKLGFIRKSGYLWHYDEFGMYWRVLAMQISSRC